MYIKKNTFLNYKPEYIALELTNVCNFSCSFCPQSNPNHHKIVPKSYLSEEACRLYLSKIRNAGITTNLMHWTQDGEPFLNTKFPNIVNISYGRGVGYVFEEEVFDESITSISATKIRKKLREKGELD